MTLLVGSGFELGPRIRLVPEVGVGLRWQRETYPDLVFGDYVDRTLTRGAWAGRVKAELRPVASRPVWLVAQAGLLVPTGYPVKDGRRDGGVGLLVDF